MAIDVDSPADGANREARALTIALELQITNSPIYVRLKLDD
jgi:hypothetical protein